MAKFQGIEVDDFFPYKNKDGKASYRPYQQESINKALNALISQDYDLFILDAPVGFGKSAVLITIERVLSELGMDSYYTTPLIVLQEQLVEFEDLPQIKGRGNYTCLDNTDVKCSEGECQYDDKYKCPFELACTYTSQRDKCIASSLCGLNTSYLMTVRREVFNERDLLACDEAHSIPEAGVGFVGITIRESDIKFIPDFPAGFEAYYLWLKNMILPAFKIRIKELKEQVRSFGKTKRKAQLGLIDEFKSVRDVIRKIEKLIDDYEKYNEEWLVDISTDSKGKKINFQPLTSGRFLKDLLWNRGDKILLSSGTITPLYYIKEGGLTNKSFSIKDCVIEIPSDFPSELSPIYYKSIGKLTKDLKPLVFPKIMKEVNSVLRERQDRKGIVHSFSYENSDYVFNNIDNDLKHLVVKQDRYNRSSSLKNWMNNENPSLFISTNMSEGIDLKGDLCNYQIYVKIGYPNITDKRVAKRLKNTDWLWYSMQAIEDIEQASGRATRSKDDSSEMFIYDSSFASLYTRYNKFMKPWFKERLKFIPVS